MGRKVLMPLNSLPETVRQFVFEHIDSVEQLEVLLFMRAHREASHDSHHISAELRSNPQSVLKRILVLEAGGFVSRLEAPKREADETLLFQYQTCNVDIDKTIEALADVYKKKPQRIFELIFSPLKKGRQFAAAFLVTGKKEKDNG